jgi:RND family efflux transporter MFP subunit
MTAVQFLAEWALRSSVLILSGALLLRVLHVKDPSIRLAAWTAMLCGSLAIPALTTALPKAPFTIMRPAAPRAETLAAAKIAIPAPEEPVASRQSDAVSKPSNWKMLWPRAALTLYAFVALGLLLRLGFGLAMSLRLLRGSRETGRATHGITIRESHRVATPVTLGILRPAIVLPADWSEWDAARLQAVLAHERSHIQRRDPAVQLLSALHRALLWYSPLAWFLHRRIVRTAEDASDDAAVGVIHDRALYAEMLLDFMRRAAPTANWQGVPMARYGRADQRIHRILDETVVSRGVRPRTLAAILALGAPVAYLVAAAQPQVAPPAQTAPSVPDPSQVPVVTQPVTQSVAQPAPAPKPQSKPVYLMGLGNVAAYFTVNVKSRVDGQLMSVNFNEGGLVQAGQVLASIDPTAYQLQVAQAEGQLARDQAQAADFKAFNKNTLPKADFDFRVSEFEGTIATDQAKVDDAKRQLTYTQITSPITGVAGLRLIDPGNIVHASDATGIVIIKQLQPIAVLFTIPEDSLPEVRARLSQASGPPVEAWDRTNATKIAAGRLTAVDNQIDQQTGTATLKAVFDNKDGALFPNEFVNVRMLLNSK